MVSETYTSRGRPRNPAIDAAVLAAVREQLRDHGVSGISVRAAAAAAGTTRAAVYRRWPTIGALLVAAVSELADRGGAPVGDDPLADLEAELRDFRDAIRAAGSVGLVGVMLQGDVDPAVRAEYRRRVVAPRRSRLRACLERGVAAGRLDADADLDGAVAMATGAWYAAVLAGPAPAREWPERTARLVWGACGGRA